MDAVTASNLLLLIFLGIAVVGDYKTMKISNRLILFGYVLVLANYFMQDTGKKFIYVLWNISFPVILLYLFYLIGAIGAGDIKLFSIVGGFLNFKELWECMLFSFVIAAIASLLKMLWDGTLFIQSREALYYFGELVRGQRKKYSWKTGKGGNLIHFAPAILAGYLMTQLLHGA